MTPKLKNQTIIECQGLDEMEECYELYDPIKETDFIGLEAVRKTISEFREKCWPYCITVDHINSVTELHFWVEGTEE